MDNFLFKIYKEERLEEISLEKAEKYLFEADLDEEKIKSWKDFAANYKEGDEIYICANMQEAFEYDNGYSALKLVRDNQVIAEYSLLFE